MERITVEKAQLLAKLEQNRTDHRAIFEEALEGFKAEVTGELEQTLVRLRSGLYRDVRISRPVPVDHTRDYDRAIEMVKMAIGDEITLTEEDFASYVMDDWGWQGQFLRNVYGSGRARTKFSDAYVVE